MIWYNLISLSDAGSCPVMIKQVQYLIFYWLFVFPSDTSDIFVSMCQQNQQILTLLWF